METVFLWIGKTFCVIGGITLALFFMGLFLELAIEAWKSFSNRFRNVCKAESLIFEYKKNRKEFLRWIDESKSSHES